MLTYVHQGDFELTNLDGDWIILDSKQLTITKVNEVGGYCWSLLNKKQTVGSLLEAVRMEFPELKVSELDIKEYLDSLIECELVRYEV